MAATVAAADRIAEIIERKKTSAGLNLAVMSLVSPVLVVFLRHPGCTFCRETLADVGLMRARVEAQGMRIVIVYHGRRKSMEGLLARYGLVGVDSIHDADLALYKAFGLGRGSLKQVFGWDVWKRMFGGALKRYGVGYAGGDPWQMPGVFIIDNGVLSKSFRHRLISDRVPYKSILT